MDEDQGCPEGCSYLKIGEEPTDIWCIGHGDYRFSDVCKTSYEVGTTPVPTALETTTAIDL